MTDPDTPEALRAIASMMGGEGYKPDADGIEALVVSNAADEIEALWLERTHLLAEITELNRRIILLQNRLYLNNINHNIEEKKNARHS